MRGRTPRQTNRTGNGRDGRTEYRITSEWDGLSLKSFLRAQGYSTGSMIVLKKREDGLLVNGAHATVRCLLRSGDLLTVAEEDRETKDTLVPVPMALEILYEDDEYLVINKPPRMPTHPSHGHREDTLANGLAARFAEKGIPFVFRACSRLDRDTSGVVPVAKTQRAAFRFAQAHREGLVEKRYLAVLEGTLPEREGVITLPIRRENDSVIRRITAPDGAPSRTEYRVLGERRAEDETVLTLVSACPVTGRTHQLRVHFASAGAPVLGDFLYGKESDRIGRQALHAAKIAFPGADGARITAEAPVPADLDRLIRWIGETDAD